MKTILMICGVLFMVEVAIFIALLVFGKRCSEYCDACDDEYFTDQNIQP